MALARNLQPKSKRKLNLKWPKFQKKTWVAILVSLAVILGGLGWWSIARVTNNDEGKMEIKYETGDRPLPESVTIWVKVDGGLNLRETPDAKGKILKLIPDGTELTATELEDDWYKVTYMGKTGWVSKSYVTTTPPAEDPTKGWKTYQNIAAGYSLRYPTDWVAQDYGANPATSSSSYVAFGAQLPASLDPINLPPVVVRITAQSIDAAAADYKSATGSVAKSVTISGLSGTVYTYTAENGVQQTAYLVAKGPKVFVIEESGGYSDELAKMVASLVLG